MKTTRIFFFLFLALVCATQVPAQIVEPEGKVLYDLKISGKDMDPMAVMMMAGSTLEMSFKGDYTRAVMKMSLMKTTAIVNSKEQKGIMLMDMLGKKMAMEMSDEQFGQAKGNSGSIKIEKAEGSKKIAGHACNLAYAIDSTGERYEIWYCPYLNVGQAAAAAGFGYEGIEGLPLEMDFSRDGMKMRMIAKSVSVSKQDAALFKLDIPSGYDMMTEKELEGMMK